MRKLLGNGNLARMPTLAGLTDGNMTTFGLALADSPASAELPYDYDAVKTLSSGTPEAARYYAINSNGTAGKSRLLDKFPGTPYAVEALLHRSVSGLRRDAPDLISGLR